MGAASFPPRVTVQITRRDQAVGAVFTAAAIAGLLATIGALGSGLALMLLVSFGWWASGRWQMDASRALPRATIAVLVVAAHMAEEFATGFPREFPGLFGNRPWSDAQFLGVTGTALVVFAFATLGARRGIRLAYLPLFFLALGGGIANGLAHLAAAAWRGGYSPGLFTAPLCLIAGAALLAATSTRTPRPHGSGPR